MIPAYPKIHRISSMAATIDMTVLIRLSWTYRAPGRRWPGVRLLPPDAAGRKVVRRMVRSPTRVSLGPIIYSR